MPGVIKLKFFDLSSETARKRASKGKSQIKTKTSDGLFHSTSSKWHRIPGRFFLPCAVTQGTSKYKIAGCVGGQRRGADCDFLKRNKGSRFFFFQWVMCGLQSVIVTCLFYSTNTIIPKERKRWIPGTSPRTATAFTALVTSFGYHVYKGINLHSTLQKCDV